MIHPIEYDPAAANAVDPHPLSERVGALLEEMEVSQDTMDSITTAIDELARKAFADCPHCEARAIEAEISSEHKPAAPVTGNHEFLAGNREPHNCGICGARSNAPWHEEGSGVPDDYQQAPAPPAAPVVEEGLDTQARAIIKRIAGSAIGLAVTRYGLTSDEFDEADYPDLDGVDALGAFIESLKADTVNCMTGDETGCLDPEDLDEDNCEIIWLKSTLSNSHASLLAERSELLARITNLATLFADAVTWWEDKSGESYIPLWVADARAALAPVTPKKEE